MRQWKTSWSLLGIFLIFFGQISLEYPALGAPEEKLQLQTVGLRYGGVEYYAEDCAEVVHAALEGAITSASSSRCGELTPLHAALMFHPEVVPDLLQAGADVNATTGGGMTPLHLATRQGEYAAASLLLSSGADALASTDYGWNTLHTLYMAEKSSDHSSTSRKEIAESLIAAGVDINGADIGGLTPLHIAAVAVNDGIRELLLLGAMAAKRDNKGVPVEFYAALKGDTVGAEKARVAAGDPIDHILDNGQTKKEWVSSIRKYLDSIKYTFEPEEIKVQVPSKMSFQSSGPSIARQNYFCKARCNYWYRVRAIACGIGTTLGVGSCNVLVSPCTAGTIILGGMCLDSAVNTRETCKSNCDARYPLNLL